jgi:hypothetical protein
LETPQALNNNSFERVRESLWGAPGFQRRNSTITTPGWSFLPQGTWIKEVIHVIIIFPLMFLALALWLPTLGHSMEWLEELDIRLTLWER